MRKLLVLICLLGAVWAGCFDSYYRTDFEVPPDPDTTRIRLIEAPWGTLVHGEPNVIVRGEPGAVEAHSKVFVHTRDGRAVANAQADSTGAFEAVDVVYEGGNPVTVTAEDYDGNRSAPVEVERFTWLERFTQLGNTSGAQTAWRLAAFTPHLFGHRQSRAVDFAALERPDGRWVASRAGLEWTEVLNSPPPPPLHEHELVFVPTHGYALGHGGRDGPSISGATYQWFDGRWSVVDVPIGQGPGKLAQHAMAYDSWRDEVVLFGGMDGEFNPVGDTWVWFNEKWRSVEVVGPSRRTGHALAFDPMRGQAVLFGGRGDDGTRMSDTWIWDGVGWSETGHDCSSAPSPRSGHALAYDGAQNLVLLFGGDPGGGEDEDDQWVWDGRCWVEQHPERRPGPRAHHAMATSVDDGEIWLIGGTTGRTATLWNWNGEEWDEAGVVERAAERGHKLTAIDGGLLLTGDYFEQLESTWVLQGGQWRGRTYSDSWFPPGLPSNEPRAMVSAGPGEALVLGPTSWRWDGALLSQSPSSDERLPNYRFSDAHYDAASGQTLFVGYREPDKAGSPHTLAYLDGEWSQASGLPDDFESRPSAGDFWDRLFFDPTVGGLVLVSIRESDGAVKSWLWDGGWKLSQRLVVPIPEILRSTRTVFADEVTGEVVVSGVAKGESKVWSAWRLKEEGWIKDSMSTEVRAVDAGRPQYNPSTRRSIVAAYSPSGDGVDFLDFREYSGGWLPSRPPSVSGAPLADSKLLLALDSGSLGWGFETRSDSTRALWRFGSPGDQRAGIVFATTVPASVLSLDRVDSVFVDVLARGVGGADAQATEVMPGVSVEVWDTSQLGWRGLGEVEASLTRLPVAAELDSIAVGRPARIYLRCVSKGKELGGRTSSVTVDYLEISVSGRMGSETLVGGR